MNILIIYSAKYLLFVSMVIAVLYFLKQPRQKQKEALVFALILFPLSYIVAKIISRFYFDPRPFVTGNFTPLIPHAPDNGFPSDHTLLGAAIAAVIFRLNKKAGLLLFFMALFVGLARILAGVHHAADIAGSMLVVLAVYFFSLMALGGFSKRSYNIGREKKTKNV
ncbi:MAG: phosphatase PAP2 family protein [Candidatus Moranbacteria bacterium]|nr:phosphatase PAP2 family protein [Candidatus Moranbacteria bacterium]